MKIMDLTEWKNVGNEEFRNGQRVENTFKFKISKCIVQIQIRKPKRMSNLDYKYSSENSSTEGDSSSDRQQEIYVYAPVLRTNPLKHKTELCKTYSELGFCNYGDKCRFAHGRHELINGCQGKLHKDRKCKGFWKNGVCPYGIRCQFGHGENDWTTNSCLIGMAAVVKPSEQPQQSRLLRLL